MSMKMKSKGPFLVISHPEKGSFRLYLMDDNDNDKGPDVYQADKAQCRKEVRAGGLVINGELVTDRDIIQNYLEEAEDALETAAINAIEAGKRDVDDDLRQEILPHLESINFDEAVNECMSVKGWSTRMGTKADLN